VGIVATAPNPQPGPSVEIAVSGKRVKDTPRYISGSRRMKMPTLLSILLMIGACISCSKREMTSGKQTLKSTEHNHESLIEAYSLFAQAGVIHLSSYEIRSNVEHKDTDALLIQHLRREMEGHHVNIARLEDIDRIQEKHLLAMILSERNNIPLEFRIEDSEVSRDAKIKMLLEKLCDDPGCVPMRRPLCEDH
jgi:hypothetical protein